MPQSISVKWQVLRPLWCPPATIYGNTIYGPNSSHTACKLPWGCLHCSKQAFTKALEQQEWISN